MFGRRVATASGLACALMLGMASSAHAVFDGTDKVWEGITFSNEGAPGVSEVSGVAPNDIFSSQNSSPGYFAGTIGWFANPTNAGGVNAATFANINANGTPWFKITFTDNTVPGDPLAPINFNDISLFIGGPPGGTLADSFKDPRMKLGEYFGNPYTAVQNLSVASPNNESAVYVGPSYPSFPASPRVDGDVITIMAGRLPSGVLEFTFQSANLNGGVPVVTQSTYYNDNGITNAWNWNNISLRYRKSGSGIPAGTTIVFNNLEYGNDYGALVPEPASLGLLGLGGLLMLRRKRLA